MLKFHVHIDAMTLSDDFENYLTKELGFWRNDFSGHPEGAEAYEPAHHLTQKVATSRGFRRVFDQVLTYVKSHAAMRGHIEGEFVALDKDIGARPFDAAVKPPFKLHRVSLRPGTFRESEVHVTLSKDQSDPRLLQNLMDMGLFAAYMPKSYGTAQIFNAQGSRKAIRTILPLLVEYFERAGGAVGCSVKEERIADWWMSEPDLRLPPIIDSIEWSL